MAPITREQFARRLLDALTAPQSRRNLIVMMAWMEGEDTEAAFNPLATTQSMEGASMFNYAGVRNYRSVEDGVEATRRTLIYGASRDLYGYAPILRRLQRSAMPRRTLRAVKKSMWGTGDLALSALGRVKADYDSYARLPIHE